MRPKSTSPSLRPYALGLCLLLIAGSVPAAPPAPGPTIGTNLGFLASNTGDWPFVDVFKTAEGWYASGDCGWDCGTLDLDDDGWVRSLEPGQMATALIFTDVSGMMPHDDVSQQYDVFYDGIGVVDYDGVVSVTSVAPGHDRVAIDPASGGPFALTIILTARTWDPDEPVPATEYIRNIRVFAPGGVCADSAITYCSSQLPCSSGAACNAFVTNNQPSAPLFHPQFLANVEPFGLVRVMDWLDTIEGGQISADELTEESDAFWNRAPATVMATLANTLDVDLWINVPHLASDALVTSLAADLAANLETARKLHVEYSNELWNPDFPAYQAIAELGCGVYSDLTADCFRRDAQGVVIAGLPICHDHAADPIEACDTARIRYTADRSLGAWQIFETAFDAQSSPGGNGNNSAQLVRVLASQSGNVDLHADLLARPGMEQTVDAFTTAAYFGWALAGDGIVQGWETDNAQHMSDLFDRLVIEVDDTIADMTADRQFLLTHDQGRYSSIPLVFYEGGQGLVSHGANVDPLDPNVEAHANEVFDFANRDPRMALRYRQLLDGWRNHGGDLLLNHYVNVRRYTGEERYGALEHMFQPGSAKYDELLSYIAGLP